MYFVHHCQGVRLLSIHSEMGVILLLLCGSLEIDKALDVTLERCLLLRGWGLLGGPSKHSKSAALKKNILYKTFFIYYFDTFC